jgi:DNA-binding CsgD family transcriptional regulator
MRPRIYDYDEIARLWLDGNSMKKVAEIVGCAQPTVREALKKKGFEPSTRRPRHDSEVVTEAVRYYQEHPGMTQGEVARMFGLGPYTIRNRLIYGPLRGRVYAMKIDRDECRALYAQGMTQTELARHYGVTHRAVGIVLRAGGEHTCEVCGVPVDIGSQFCRHHVGHNKIKRGPGNTLWCPRCSQWKPEADFYPSPDKPIRARNGQCKTCENKARTERRRRRGEVQREYERARYARRKAAGLPK